MLSADRSYVAEDHDTFADKLIEEEFILQTMLVRSPRQAHTKIITIQDTIQTMKEITIRVESDDTNSIPTANKKPNPLSRHFPATPPLFLWRQASVHHILLLN